MPVLLSQSVSFLHVKNGDHTTGTSKSLQPKVRQGILSSHFKAASATRDAAGRALYSLTPRCDPPSNPVSREDCCQTLEHMAYITF